MLGSPNNFSKYRQPPSSVDNYRALNDLVMKPTSARTPRRLSPTQNDEWNDDNRTVRKLVENQPLNPARFRSSSNTSLKSLIIDGQWKYRGHDDDHLRLKSMGIENLVGICHDIMKTTYELTNRKQEKPRRPVLTKDAWRIVKLDEYKKLTNADRVSLRRAHVFDLMTIVYEAASTSASISQLVRIWREASEHALHPRRSKSSEYRPLISYEKAFQHLIRTPDDQLLQIAVHASLISTRNRSDLQRLGEHLGIKRNQFDMDSIRDSTKAFQKFIKFLRERKLREKQEQRFIDINRLPYKPKKKKGLHVNVSGTKFRLSKSTFL
jgi:hypothetical protein